MATVYKITRDVDKYQSLISDDDGFRRKYRRFNGTSFANNWSPPEMYVLHPKLLVPDFWPCSFAMGAFAVSDDLAGNLSRFFSQAGELLPLQPYDGRKLQLFNITNVVDALDKKKSIYDHEEPSLIDKYVFHAKRLKFSLFKIPETAGGQSLTVEGIAAPHDEFKPTVERMGLKGLLFEKLWSDGD